MAVHICHPSTSYVEAGGSPSSKSSLARQRVRNPVSETQKESSTVRRKRALRWRRESGRLWILAWPDPIPSRAHRAPVSARPAIPQDATHSSRKSRNSFWHFSATSSRTSGCWLPAPGSAAAARSMAAPSGPTTEERPPRRRGRSYGRPGRRFHA